MAETAVNLAGNINKEDEYIRQAELLLEEKYGEAFRVSEYLGHDYTRDYYEAAAYAEDYPQLSFLLKAACDGSYISDGYVAARVCEKIEEQMERNLAGLMGYLVVKAQPVSRNIDSNQADMSVSDFMELKTKNRFLIYLVYVTEGALTESFYQTLTGAFKNLELLSGRLELYVTDEETAKRAAVYFEEHPEIYSGIYGILDEKQAKVFPFENGTLQM